MPEEPPSAALDREITTNIVAAHVRRNRTGFDQLGALIATVHRALEVLGKPPTEVSDKRISRRLDSSISSPRLFCLPRMRLARPDAQAASRYQSWIDRCAVSYSLEPPP
jgi:predicted transcriptional regulator